MQNGEGMTTADHEAVAGQLLAYLGDALQLIRSWMNTYFTFAGLFALALLVTAFQLERECDAITTRAIFTIPMVLPEGCRVEGSDKPLIELFGAEVLRDFVSIVLGLAYAVFISVLLLRIRSLTGILAQLSALSDCRDRSEEVASDIRYFPWVASPFRNDAIGSAIFWCGLGLGVFVVGATGVIHLLPPDHDDLVIGKRLYQVIGVVNLVLFFFSLSILSRIAGHIAIVRSAAARSGERNASS